MIFMAYSLLMAKNKNLLTFADIVLLTQTEDAAVRFAQSMRWPDGACCHWCRSKSVTEIKGRRGRWRCLECKRHFSVRSGTAMQNSKLPISTWIRALWLVQSSTRGISSCALARMLGVQQKTAWFLLHRLREMMAWAISPPVVDEDVEIDEVYAGAPRRKRSHHRPSGVRSGRGDRRPLVLTVVGRSGQVRMRRIRSHDRRSIHTCARSLIGRATRVHTDSLPAYRGIASDHRRVTHSRGEFARIDPDLVSVHVNSAEAAHSELRRVVMGVYHHLSSMHLDRYLSEISCRRSHALGASAGHLSSLLSAPVSLPLEKLKGTPF